MITFPKSMQNICYIWPKLDSYIYRLTAKSACIKLSGGNCDKHVDGYRFNLCCEILEIFQIAK